MKARASSLFWKLVVRLGGQPPQPLKRYVVMKLAPGRYLNSPRTWKTRCEITAKDATTAAALLRETSSPNEPYVIVPFAPDVDGIPSI